MLKDGVGNLNFIEENNKRKISKCFILYVDKECKQEEREKVCNFSCVMCYYRFSNQKFKTLQEMKNEVNEMVSRGANHVQITGAEPTMHKDIFELLDFIKTKNVLCSMITNGYLLSVESLCEKLKGKVDYLLMSVHGRGKKWSEISQVPHTWENTLKALANCKKHGIEVHFNTTVLKQNYKDLGNIVQLAIDNDVKRCNFISFNPFCSFKTAAGQSEVDKLIVSYDESMPYLEEAYDLCMANNIDFAMRYFPFCKVPAHMRKYVFNYSTLQFDWNEWNYQFWFPSEFNPRIDFLRKLAVEKQICGSDEQKLQHCFGRFYPPFRSNFKESEVCKMCNDYFICDTPHLEQVIKFPNQKFSGTKSPLKKDAKYYINGGI